MVRASGAGHQPRVGTSHLQVGRRGGRGDFLGRLLGDDVRRGCSPLGWGSSRKQGSEVGSCARRDAPAAGPRAVAAGARRVVRAARRAAAARTLSCRRRALCTELLPGRRKSTCHFLNCLQLVPLTGPGQAARARPCPPPPRGRPTAAVLRWVQRSAGGVAGPGARRGGGVQEPGGVRRRRRRRQQ